MDPTWQVADALVDQEVPPAVTGTIKIQAGGHVITAAGPVPVGLRDASATSTGVQVPTSVSVSRILSDNAACYAASLDIR
jgi:hypothetical protein